MKRKLVFTICFGLLISPLYTHAASLPTVKVQVGKAIKQNKGWALSQEEIKKQGEDFEKIDFHFDTMKIDIDDLKPKYLLPSTPTKPR